MRIFVDADGCPVKAEVVRVASRHGVETTFVSNSPLRIPAAEGASLVVVPGAFDAADDWIVQHAAAGDVVVTADIPLAARCVKAGAVVLDHKGGEWTDENVGSALAARELSSHLRAMGGITGGPSPFSPKDRSRFLHRLDEVLRRAPGR